MSDWNNTETLALLGLLVAVALATTFDGWLHLSWFDFMVDNG